MSSRSSAVVTGASSGISRELATNGFDLLIAAEDDAIALHAGIDADGSFAGGEQRTTLEDELRIVDLNIRSTMQLAKHVTGRVLFTSWIAAKPALHHKLAEPESTR